MLGTLQRAARRVLGIEPRSALDNPNLSWADRWELAFSGGTVSDAGTVVTPRHALTYPPAWQAVNLISGDIAAMPFDLYQRRPDIGENARKKAIDHPVHKLVRWSPYPGWHDVKFWRRMMVHALLWNNAYAVIQHDEMGTPESMLPLLPDRTKPVDREGEYFYISEINGRLVPFSPHQILHIEGISIDGTADCETVFKLRNSIGLGLAAENFASKFFKRGGRTGGVLELPAEMKKKAMDTVEAGFRRTYESVDAAFMTFVARDNVKFHKAQFNAEESQMQGTREQQALDASRIWNVPPHKLGIANTVSYNSLEQENRSYHGTALVHWNVTIAAECRIKLLTEDEQELYYFEHNTDSILSTDAMSRTQVAQMEINMGTLSRDEYRAMVNRNPREDGGGGFVESVQFSGDPGETVDVEDEPEEPGEAARAFMEDSIDRGLRRCAGMIRRETKRKKPQQFCTWFDDSFSEVQQAFEDEIASAAACYPDTQLRVDELSARAIGVLKSDIDNCLNTCTPDRVVDEIADILSRHIAQQIPYQLEA